MKMVKRVLMFGLLLVLLSGCITEGDHRKFCQDFQKIKGSNEPFILPLDYGDSYIYSADCCEQTYVDGHNSRLEVRRLCI